MITRTIYDEIVKACDASPDKEACGFVTFNSKTGVMNFFQVKNISEKNPEVHFEMDPTELYQVLSRTSLMRPNSDEQLYMTWHSHPTGMPIPSVTDFKRLHYDCFHLIYGMWHNWMSKEDQAKYKPVRLWKYNPIYFDEVQLKIID